MKTAAWSGHKTLSQVQHYARAVDQKRLAQAAADNEKRKLPN